MNRLPDPFKEEGKPLFKESDGNIWGWKFSWISLVIILLSLGMLLLRQKQHPNEPIFYDPSTSQPAQPKE